MRHGVLFLFYEATGLIPADLTFPHGVLFYDSTRREVDPKILLVKECPTAHHPSRMKQWIAIVISGAVLGWLCSLPKASETTLLSKHSKN